MREKKPEPRTQNRRAATGYSYRNLIVWQKAQDLAVSIIRLTASLPKKTDAQIIAKQIIRSATSIGANIAEGHGRYAMGAHKNHLSIAKASATETGSWLDLLYRLDYIDAETEARLNHDAEELVRMLVTMIRRLDQLTTQREESNRVSDGFLDYLLEDIDSGSVLGSEV